MSDQENAFIAAATGLSTAANAYNETISGSFEELALANEQQEAHRNDKNNPHGLSKADVGLDKVENRATAQLQDVVDMTNLDRMVTPFILKELIQSPEMTSGAVLNAVRTPKPVSPINSVMTDRTDQVTLVADTYRHMYSREIDNVVQRIPRQSREFEIYPEDINVDTPVWTGSVNADEITATMTFTRNTVYRWRCRDISIDGEEGAWSGLARFTAPSSEVVTPTVSIEGQPTNVLERPLITTSPFATNGDGDTHVSTTWRLFNLNAGAPSWEETSSQDLESIRLPAGLLSPGVSYQFEVIHNSSGAGSASSGRVIFTTKSRFPLIPGPLDLAHGDDTLGYFGEVQAQDFLSGDQLTVLTGFGAGQSTPWSATSSWIKVKLDGKILYVARYPIRSGFRGTDLEAIGLYDGGKEITIQQTVYKCRLLQGWVPGFAKEGKFGDYPENDPSLTGGSEWDRLMQYMFGWMGVGSDEAAIGLTDTYRHNAVDSPFVYVEHQPGQTAPAGYNEVPVRGGGQFPAGDSRKFTYVNTISHIQGNYDAPNPPEILSWRPVLELVG